MALSNSNAKKTPVKPAARRAKKVVNAPSAFDAMPEVALPVMVIEAEMISERPDKNKKKDKSVERAKPKKPKLIRDSFTMPELEYEALVETKKAMIRSGVAIKKSELLRIAVAQLASMDVAQIAAALRALAPVKAGRPLKEAN